MANEKTSVKHSPTVVTVPKWSLKRDPLVNIWVFPKIMGKPPKSSHFSRVFHYKPSIFGYHYFWKTPIYSPDFWIKTVANNFILIISNVASTKMGVTENCLSFDTNHVFVYKTTLLTWPMSLPDKVHHDYSRCTQSQHGQGSEGQHLQCKNPNRAEAHILCRL